MELNAYFVELLVRERLAQARAFAERRALIDALRPPRRPVRMNLGLALIRIGHWILGSASNTPPSLTGVPCRGR